MTKTIPLNSNFLYSALIILQLIAINIICEPKRLLVFVKISGLRNIGNFENRNIMLFINGDMCFNENMSVGRSYSDSSINISNCFFSRSLQYSGDGGIIYVNSGSYSLFVSDSAFHYCYCTANGGAIYFSSLKSSLTMICAHMCYAVSSNFARIQASSNNYIEYLTMASCFNTTVGEFVLLAFSGDQKLDRINSSMNFARMASGITIHAPDKFSSSFCSFSNNVVYSNICLYLSCLIGTISFANIVSNNSPSGYGVVYVYGGSPTVNNSVFYSNQNNLFYLQSGSFDLFNNYISHTGYTSSHNNNCPTRTQTYQIQYYKTIYCHADDPVSIQSQKSTWNEHLKYSFVHQLFGVIIIL